ncbi:hypothetical protein GCM10027036_40040 [Flavihumibacter cheonanensis]
MEEGRKEEGGMEKVTTETGDKGDRGFIDSKGGTTVQCQRKTVWWVPHGSYYLRV